jgi:electron transfer flavoprotein beta subunit
VVTGSLPALITCEDGLNTPRYAKLPDIMKAKRKPLENTSVEAIGLSSEAIAARSTTSGYAPPPARPAGRILEGDAATVAAELVRLLRDEAKVL